MGTAAAVVLIKERQVVEAFRRACAVDAERALAPEALGLDAEGLGWRRLHRRAVVRESAPGSGRYYLDLDVWEAMRGTRRRMLLAVLIVALAAFFASYLYGWGGGAA